jgi:hypothetical protein
LRLAGIGPGDEVITTPLTWVATANVILEVGATPVFADVDPVTRNIDLDRVAAAITPRTRALIPVDLAGLPVDRDPSNAGDFGARDFHASYYTEGLKRTPNLYDLVFEQPQVATKILEDLGISADDFAYYAWEADNVRQ